MVSARSLTFARVWSRALDCHSPSLDFGLGPSPKCLSLDRHADPEPPNQVTKAEIEAHFGTHGTGEITEIKLMNGFGFIEYKDAMDARDVVPGEIFSTSTTPSELLPSIPPCAHRVFCLVPMANLNSAQLSVRRHPIPLLPLPAPVTSLTLSLATLNLSLNLSPPLTIFALQDGSTLMGERLTVQFARGSRHRENGAFPSHGAERGAPRPRRTPHRMQISGLPSDTSWQVCSSSSSLLPDSWICLATAVNVWR